MTAYRYEDLADMRKEQQEQQEQEEAESWGALPRRRTFWGVALLNKARRTKCPKQNNALPILS